MKKLRKRSMKIALNILTALEANYTITLPDGAKYSNASEESVIGRGRKFNGGRKYGELSAHYRPFMEKLEPSGFVEVPFNGFKPTELGNAISAWGCQRWGRGSTITSTGKTGIEVMRIK